MGWKLLCNSIFSKSVLPFWLVLIMDMVLALVSGFLAPSMVVGEKIFIIASFLMIFIRVLLARQRTIWRWCE